MTGAALATAAINGLYAQAKPPAYLVIEVDVTDADLYKQYLAKNAPLTARFGGRFIARGGKIDAFAGEPPKRAVIAMFDSLDKWESNFAACVIGLPQVGHSSRPNLSNMGFPPRRSNRRRGGWFHEPVIRGRFCCDARPWPAILNP